MKEEYCENCMYIIPWDESFDICSFVRDKTLEYAYDKPWAFPFQQAPGCFVKQEASFLDILMDNLQDLDPKYSQVVDENFWDLVDSACIESVDREINQNPESVIAPDPGLIELANTLVAEIEGEVEW